MIHNADQLSTSFSASADGNAGSELGEMEIDEWEDFPETSSPTPAGAATRHRAEAILIGDGHGIRAQSTVRYNDLHPTSRAGEPIRQDETMDTCYTQAVHAQHNIWAPFRTRVDWEVAHWAKLRGPGSTAFSDLLSIPEVCLICF